MLSPLWAGLFGGAKNIPLSPASRVSFSGQGLGLLFSSRPCLEAGGKKALGVPSLAGVSGSCGPLCLPPSPAILGCVCHWCLEPWPSGVQWLWWWACWKPLVPFLASSRMGCLAQDVAALAHQYEEAQSRAWILSQEVKGLRTELEEAQGLLREAQRKRQDLEARWLQEKAQEARRLNWANEREEK